MCLGPVLCLLYFVLVVTSIFNRSICLFECVECECVFFSHSNFSQKKYTQQTQKNSEKDETFTGLDFPLIYIAWSHYEPSSLLAAYLMLIVVVVIFVVATFFLTCCLEICSGMPKTETTTAYTCTNTHARKHKHTLTMQNEYHQFRGRKIHIDWTATSRSQPHHHRHHHHRWMFFGAFMFSSDLHNVLMSKEFVCVWCMAWSHTPKLLGQGGGEISNRKT